MQETNWSVLTGPPNSGKTTLIHVLRAMGYTVIPESAREVLASSPTGTPGVVEMQGGLQEQIFLTQKRKEDSLNPEEPLFLDRGVPDSMAYNQIVEQRSPLIIDHRMPYRYQTVFFCHAVPLQRDGLRSEDESWNRRVGQTLQTVYRDLGYDLIELTADPKEPATRSIARRLREILRVVEEL